MEYLWWENKAILLIVYLMKFLGSFFANIIGLAGRKNKRIFFLEITKHFYFHIQIIKILNKKWIKW